MSGLLRLHSSPVRMSFQNFPSPYQLDVGSFRFPERGSGIRLSARRKPVALRSRGPELGTSGLVSGRDGQPPGLLNLAFLGEAVWASHGHGIAQVICRYKPAFLQAEIRLVAVKRRILFPIFWAAPRDTLGAHTVLTREGLTMSNALQHWGRQDAFHRLQPWAVLEGSTRTQPMLPTYASPAPEQLSTAAITLLETYGRVKGYPKNTALLYAGTPSPACYVVLSGRVRVYVSAPNGKELTLSLLGLGEPFGDLGLLEEALYMGTAVTLTPTTLLVVPRASFGACVAAHPDLALEFLRLAAQRINHLTSLAHRLAFADVQSRITTLLSTLVQEQAGDRGGARRLTHQEIADMIGATRETVCRVMKELYGSGCITLENGRLRVGAHPSQPPGMRPSTGASSHAGRVPTGGA
jgi:CRP/FNR family cyclic AMP-dependent transcriptional regulator